jgi:N-dimethylarginine dimethylaminohydrolase
MHSWPKSVLMVKPNGYRVEYAINPYMRDSNGQLHKVDEPKALQQWHALAQTLQKLGLRLDILEGDPQFPDMVFCANQTLPYWDTNGQASILLSRMHSKMRQGEVRHFSQWAEQRGFPCNTMTDFAFEGAGDAIWNYATREIYAGYGWRSERHAYAQIAKLCSAKIHLLELVSENFYHLDTCFAVLNATTAAYVPEAFSPAARELLQQKFRTLITINHHEAITTFAGNCVSVDGHHVILQAGSPQFCQNLTAQGFTPIEVNTSEFIKAGGSAFCMKQFLF